MSVERRGTRIPAKTRRLFAPGGVKAGVLAGATYPADLITDARTGEQKPDPRAGMAVATIAAALEFGHGQNHPRPFMQTTVAREGKAWAAALPKLLQSGTGALAALQTVGQVMREDIQQTIADWPADNSEAWAATKGFNHGLIQTSHLLNSIESEVDAGASGGGTA